MPRAKPADDANEPRLPCEDAGRQTDRFRAKSILTSKELKVLELLSYGYENRDIASHFRTSSQAVKNMLRTINLKLGADNRTHAVAVCFRNGWLPNKDAAEQEITSEPRLSDDSARSKPHCMRRRYHDGTIASICTDAAWLSPAPGGRKTCRWLIKTTSASPRNAGTKCASSSTARYRGQIASGPSAAAAVDNS